MISIKRNPWVHKSNSASLYFMVGGPGAGQHHSGCFEFKFKILDHVVIIFEPRITVWLIS